MRCQAELDAANDFLATCVECDCSPPVFAAAEDMGQSCPHLEGDAADRQCGTQDVEVCTEPETAEKRSAGVEVVKKRRGTTRTASARKNPKRTKPLTRYMVSLCWQMRPMPAMRLEGLSSA